MTAKNKCTILTDKHSVNKGFVISHVMCYCGKKFLTRRSCLKSGNVRSCGCMKKKQDNKNLNRTEHGFSIASNRHPLYSCWHNMKTRCYWEKSEKFPSYGARGIAVCKEWKTKPSDFIKWCLSNGWEPGLTIDRIDNDGNYEPDNVQFLSMSDNAKKQWTDKENYNDSPQ